MEDNTVIEQGNATIALFMDYTFKEKYGWFTPEMMEQNSLREPTTLCFHNDWNNLMKVVEKIEKQKNIHIQIDYCHCVVFNFTRVVCTSIGKTKIESVWNTVVKYLNT